MARMKLKTKLEPDNCNVAIPSMIENFMATFLLLGLYGRQKSRIIYTVKKYNFSCNMEDEIVTVHEGTVRSLVENN